MAHVKVTHNKKINMDGQKRRNFAKKRKKSATFGHQLFKRYATKQLSRQTMQKLNYISLIFILVALVQGCSTLYFGHSEEEWNNFSDDEKTAIKAEYKTIINSRNEQAHTDKINARTQSVIDYGVAAPQ